MIKISNCVRLRLHSFSSCCFADSRNMVIRWFMCIRTIPKPSLKGLEYRAGFSVRNHGHKRSILAAPGKSWKPDRFYSRSISIRSYFGEGFTILNQQITQLTWQDARLDLCMTKPPFAPNEASIIRAKDGR